MSSSGGGSFVSPPVAIQLDTNAVENIRVFRRQWKYYARITGIDELLNEEVKISLLLSLMGETAGSLVDSLLEQKVAGNRNVDSILWALEKHFCLPYNNLLIYERNIFHRMMQNVDESVDNFANRVRYQGARCDFRDRVDDFVCHQFIVGLVDEHLKNFLLKNNFTFELALDLSRIVEKNDDSRRTIPATNNDSTWSVSDESLSSSPQPSCPTEDLVLAAENISSSAVCSLPFRFPSQTCPTLYQGVVHSRMAAKPRIAEPAIGTYVALRRHLKHVKGNPPIWRVHRAALLEKFTPSIEGGVKMYRSSDVYSGWSELSYDKYEKVEIERETKQRDSTGKVIRMVLPKSRVKFDVGSYIVLKSDLRANDKPPIWRVCSASLLQKLVPCPAKGEIRAYTHSNVYLVHYTDWMWRLTEEDYYEVAVTRETVKEFVVENGERGGANPSKNPKSNFSKLQKIRTGKIVKPSKKSRKRKIMRRMAIGLVSLSCCCA